MKLTFKILLVITCPIWGLPYMLIIIAKDIWVDISDWVEDNHGNN